MPMAEQEHLGGDAMQTHEARGEQGRTVPTPPTVRYPRQAANPPSRTRSRTRPVRERDEVETGATANTPWGLWTAAEGAKKDNVVSLAALMVIMEDNRRDKVGREISQRD